MNLIVKKTSTEQKVFLLSMVEMYLPHERIRAAAGVS